MVDGRNENEYYIGVTVGARGRAAPAATPLVVVVGMLGAGKTTLIRELVEGLRSRGVAPSVILNDYVNAHVDAATIPRAAAQVIPVAGACVCCGSRGELMAALEGAELGERSAMLVEANGTVDATELIEILVADPAASRYTLPLQVGVVDVRRWQARDWLDTLEAEQVRTAAFLALSRADDVTPARRRAVVQELRALSPRARPVDAGTLAQAIAALVDAPAAAPRRFGDRHGAHRHDAGRHHFSALEIPLAAEVARPILEASLRALPPEVIRAKGVARMAGEGRWVYFERVDGPGSVRLRPVEGRGLDPVAILIGVRLGGDLGMAGLQAGEPRRGE